jgi:DNA repair protein RadC
MTIKLSKEQRVKVLNGADVFKIMLQVLTREKKIDRNKEHCWVVCLDTKNKILLIELISFGSVNRLVIEPMDVFSFALQKRAVKIILVHNHPSGELESSRKDMDVTDQLQSIGDFIRVPLVDHLIISEESYLSFEEAGLLQKIKRASTYDLTFDKTKKLLSTIKKLEREVQKLKNQHKL